MSAALRCWVLLATIAAFAAGCSSEYTVGEAAKQGYVSAEIETSSEREAAITLNVLAAGAGTFTVTIAAGTRLGSTNAAVQPLVTAQKIQFGFASAPSGASQTKRVETYCLNRFLEFPARNTKLQLDIDGGGSEWEANPVRRLVTCMEKSQARYEDRQFALWMVAHNLLDRSRADVVELYREKIGRKIEHKLREQVRGEGFELVRRKFPNVRDDELRQIVEDFVESEVSQKVDAVLREEVSSYAEKAGPVLRECGYTTEGKQFFTGATLPATAFGVTQRRPQ